MINIINSLRASSSLLAAVSQWRDIFAADPDRDFLVLIAERGVPLRHSLQDLPPPASSCLPYRSATPESDSWALVQRHLLREIAAGRLIVAPPGVTSAYSHHTGALPKGSDKIRFIHDHSRPYGASLNDSIHHLPVTFGTVDDAIALIRRHGRGAFMARVDIADYFRNIPVEPLDLELLAFHAHLGQGGDMVQLWDGYLQFGLRHAPEVGQRIAAAVVRVLRRQGHDGIVALLDDYLVVADSFAACASSWRALITTLQALGFPINWGPGKTVPPRQIQIFLGVELDTLALQARLDPLKLAKAARVIHALAAQRSASIADISSAAGFLSWIAKVVYGARPLYRRLQQAVPPHLHRRSHLRLGLPLREVLLWFASRLQAFNGQAELIMTAMESSGFCSVQAGPAVTLARAGQEELRLMARDEAALVPETSGAALGSSARTLVGLLALLRARPWACQCRVFRPLLADAQAALWLDWRGPAPPAHIRHLLQLILQEAWTLNCRLVTSARCP